MFFLWRTISNSENLSKALEGNTTTHCFIRRGYLIERRAVEPLQNPCTDKEFIHMHTAFTALSNEALKHAAALLYYILGSQGLSGSKALDKGIP